MSIVFEAATPPARNNPGRTPEPNPYTDAVAKIALKTDKDGKPLALSFTLDHDSDPGKAKPVLEKARRQLSLAGKNHDPRVSVNISMSPVVVNGKTVSHKTVITFWTVKYVERKVTKKDDNTPTTANATDTATPETPDKA